MTDAWFTPEASRSLAFLSLLAITAALQPLAEQGRGRAMVMAIFGACFALGIVLLSAAGVAVLAGQPAHVIRALALSGVIVAIPFAAALKEMQRIYREAEVRKTVAADL